MILFHFVLQNVSKTHRKTPSVKGFVIVYVSWKETNGIHPHFVLFGLRIFLDKDPEADRQNIIELSRSVTKGLVACRDTTLGVFRRLWQMRSLAFMLNTMLLF